MMRRKILDIILLCLKIILPILILMPLVFFSYRLVEGRISDIENAGNESYHSGMGLYIFLSHPFLFGVNMVLLLIGAIGLMISEKYKSSPMQKKNILTFRWLALAPLVSQFLYTVITFVALYAING